jgi:hypothetical protein
MCYNPKGTPQKEMPIFQNMSQYLVQIRKIKKCPKTNAKTLPISSLSVFSVPLWFVCSFIYWDNLFPGSPLKVV